MKGLRMEIVRTDGEARADELSAGNSFVAEFFLTLSFLFSGSEFEFQRLRARAARRTVCYYFGETRLALGHSVLWRKVARKSIKGKRAARACCKPSSTQEKTKKNKNETLVK